MNTKTMLTAKRRYSLDDFRKEAPPSLKHHFEEHQEAAYYRQVDSYIEAAKQVAEYLFYVGLCVWIAFLLFGSIEAQL